MLSLSRYIYHKKDTWGLMKTNICLCFHQVACCAISLMVSLSMQHPPPNHSACTMDHGRRYPPPPLPPFAMKVSSVKVRLSLQRAKDSFETVYVGVKPGQMLLDLMMRMDSAHIKVHRKHKYNYI